MRVCTQFFPHFITLAAPKHDGSLHLLSRPQVTRQAAVTFTGALRWQVRERTAAFGCQREVDNRPCGHWSKISQQAQPIFLAAIDVCAAPLVRCRHVAQHASMGPWLLDHIRYRISCMCIALPCQALPSWLCFLACPFACLCTSCLCTADTVHQDLYFPNVHSVCLSYLLHICGLFLV